MIKLEKRDKLAELFVYGAIGDPWDGITPKDVSAALKDAKGTEEITVRINSEGGIAFDGVAIYNLLRTAPQVVSVIVDGLAASAASIVAMAGDRIVMGEGTMMMIHDPWGLVMGTAEDMRSTANVLEAITGQVAGIYASRSLGEIGDFRKLMKDETWLTADEAVELGLADEVEEREIVAAQWDLSRFQNVPDRLKPHSVDSKFRAPSQPTKPPADPPAPRPLNREHQNRRLRIYRARHIG